MSAPKYEGVSLKIGGEDFIVPSLNFFSIKKNRASIEMISRMKLGSFPTEEEFDAIITVIHAALSRNYTELTIEQVAEIVDLKNMGQIIQSVMGISGFVPSGEKKAGSGQTGIESTVTS